MVFSIRLVKNGFLEVSENDVLVAVYRYGENVRKPYFYPLYAPGGIMITRDEPPDHIHHRSLWTAHGSVNGVDIWSERPDAGFIKCVDHPTVSLRGDRCVLNSMNIWLSKAGDKLMNECRTIVFWKTLGDIRFIDYDVEFQADYSDVVLGDTKEGGTVALRVVDSMRESVGGGVITNSEGGVGEPRCWGKRARWCDYTGRVDGEVAGITILDHPGNPRHPTYWHVRAYGLFAVNCFGLSDFEGKKDVDGSMRIEKGSSVKFRYRIMLHRGRLSKDEIEKYYHEYVSM
ncbi:MAG: PmoA family protein [Nitrososphaerota archaeon]|nr:PmoA family protein [Candidatus Bathyarchaeota archaeon]MCX8161430.1 PmoA family protein [Candidatus Bathyarchaeota archaeon]MDW8061413.1 PmoA family protein [Nitrososphaerota archaeon]